MMPAFAIGAAAAALLRAFQEGSPKTYRVIAEEAARGTRLPGPTTFLDAGTEGAVFNTTDPKTVLRVTHGGMAHREWEMIGECWAGAVTIRAFETVGDFVVTWKERLNPNVEGFLIGRPNGEQIMQDLLGLYRLSPQRLKRLLSWPETRDLALAIQDGMPVYDLDLSSNLGVTPDGRIVAFDL